jgi:hypothetical protein
MCCNAQVDEMEKAVDVAEKNMSRFGLTQAEISNRRKWVLQTRRQVCSLGNAFITLLGPFPPPWTNTAFSCRAHDDNNNARA